jgi:hypothetical protein
MKKPLPARIAESWRSGGQAKSIGRALLVVVAMILLAWAYDDSAGPALVDQWGAWGRPFVIAAFVLWGLVVLVVL